MSLTVRDVLQLDVLRRGRPDVVAGRSNLSRTVRWVHIADIRDVASLLKGGELLLTSGLGVGADPDGQRVWVRQLAERGVAGIVLSLGWAFADTPGPAAGEADRLGMPMVVLRQPVPFVEVTERLHSLIVDARVSMLRKAERTGREFIELALHGGAGAVVASLARMVGNPVALEDSRHRVMEFAEFSRSDGDLLGLWEEHHRAGHRGGSPLQLRMEEGRPGCAWTIVPGPAGGWRLHVLLFGPFDAADRLAVDHAAVAIALAMASHDGLEGTREEIEGALAADALRGELRSTEELVRRGAAIGCSFDGLRLAALSVDADGFRSHISLLRMDETQIHALKRALRRAVGEAIREAGCRGITAIYNDSVAAVVGVPRNEDPRARLDAIAEATRSRLRSACGGLSVTVGAGTEARSASEVPRSFHEAGLAVRRGKAAGRAAPAVVHFDDLGVDVLLLALPDPEMVERFVRTELGPLLDGGDRQASALLATLGAYLAAGGNKAAAARSLGVDRRSLYRRLERIRELLGRDVDEADTAARLTVALRGLAIVEEGRGS